MKINVKSIIKSGFLAVGLIFAVNSAANPVTLEWYENLFMRTLGIGATVAIAKYKNASKEFMNSFLYLSGIVFTTNAVKTIPNVSQDTKETIGQAALSGITLPAAKQFFVDLFKTDSRAEERKILTNIGRYFVAIVASFLAQEAMVGGYGVLKTLIANQINA